MSDYNAPPVLRDLEGLLRKSIGEDVVVLSYKTSMLLPKGENYGSTMLKVDALIKKSKISPEEKMYFVAKMAPNAEYHKSRIDIDASLGKEIYMVKTLRNLYRQIEREAGMKEEELIDIFPKFYGGRLTKNERQPDTADADAVMLLENLIVRNYVTMDRFNGLDYEHMEVAISELARFHALGTALRKKKPELFDAARKPINQRSFNVGSESNEVQNRTIELICADSRIKKYEDRIRQSFEASKGFDAYFNVEEIEPWVSIVHGDTWVNNILFHHAENGKVDDVKFVDYQIARINNPLDDIPYLLCTSGNDDVMGNHFDKLLDTYRIHYVKELSRVGCDVSCFSKENFEQQLKKNAQFSLFRCILAIKFITMVVPQDMDMNDIKSSVMMGSANKLYYDRSWATISKFVEKDWL